MEIKQVSERIIEAKAPDIGIVAIVPSSSYKGGGSGPAKAGTFSKPTTTGNVYEFAAWGTNNLFPQEVIRDIEKSSFIGSTLDWKARALYGAGLMYGKIEGYDKDNNEIFQRVKDKQVEDFFRKSNFNRSYLLPAITNFYYFYNVFPEMILSTDRKTIADINTHDSSKCRWQLMDDDGVVNKMYLNSNWGKNGTAENSTEINVIDPFYDPAETLRERKDGFNYIYPLSYPTPGKDYYSLAHWNSLRTSGWMDVGNSVAGFKKYLLANQMTIKYVFETTELYWTYKYPNYKDLKPEERQQLYKDETENLMKYMRGEQNAGNSIMLVSGVDPVTKQIVPGLKITAIDDKIKDGNFIEDSQEASSHMLYALGVDATLIGSTPGKGIGAGSGSDKRVAFNNYISLCETHRQIILEPLKFIQQYNAWDTELEFRFRMPVIMTLDSGKQTQQQTS